MAGKAKRRSATKTATKKSAKKARKAGAKSALKRKPSTAFMRPLHPSAALGAVVGNSAKPRTEVTKKLWAYIKKNKLQDDHNRRMINADDKLRAVFGGKKQVSMFEMSKYVSRHLGPNGGDDGGPRIVSTTRIK